MVKDSLVIGAYINTNVAVQLSMTVPRSHYNSETKKYEITINAHRAIRFFRASGISLRGEIQQRATMDEERGASSPPVRTRRGC